MADNGVTVRSWPSRSSDINPIKNIWGIMDREVHQSGRPFHNVQELEDAIFEAWDKIDKTLAV